ncbi:hypothetical protein H6G76_16165 [Nostoc sp. FACHB-152]|uniref:hypothetical protein n=1 Tax=unclassified Nostoc TaxID=2593658 RepID=UPI0016830653|nr:MULTISPECIES: hypothetical protein [unclassified Nostoc]MBD2448658.1 hypothetical protein [Nostoc sp. FACHB-152]MBD2468357.1 hypothetical protein [Nostoc sp. FACHB-145]
MNALIFWGGEVGLLADYPKNKDIGSTDTLSITLTSSKQYHTSLVMLKQPIPIDPTYPPVVQMLLVNCYDAGLPVECLRLSCGYIPCISALRGLGRLVGVGGAWGSFGIALLSSVGGGWYRRLP